MEDFRDARNDAFEIGGVQCLLDLGHQFALHLPGLDGLKEFTLTAQQLVNLGEGVVEKTGVVHKFLRRPVDFLGQSCRLFLARAQFGHPDIDGILQFGNLAPGLLQFDPIWPPIASASCWTSTMSNGFFKITNWSGRPSLATIA